MQAWEAYNGALESDPLLVKSVTAGVILGAADLAGQALEDAQKEGDESSEVDIARTIRFAFFGFVHLDFFSLHWAASIAHGVHFANTCLLMMGGYLAFLLSFLVYSSASTTVLRFFNCVEYESVNAMAMFRAKSCSSGCGGDGCAWGRRRVSGGG